MMKLIQNQVSAITTLIVISVTLINESDASLLLLKLLKLKKAALLGNIRVETHKYIQTPPQPVYVQPAPPIYQTPVPQYATPTPSFYGPVPEPSSPEPPPPPQPIYGPVTEPPPQPIYGPVTEPPPPPPPPPPQPIFGQVTESTIYSKPIVEPEPPFQAQGPPIPYGRSIITSQPRHTITLRKYIEIEPVVTQHVVTNNQPSYGPQQTKLSANYELWT